MPFLAEDHTGKLKHAPPCSKSTRGKLTEPSQFDRSEAGISFVFNKGTPKVSTTF